MKCVVAEGLGKLYRGKIWGAREVSFTACEGSITVLLGPNGAGKTTSIGMLSTLLKPTRGHGIVLGYDVVRDVWIVRRHIALCPQDISVDINWTPMEAVIGYLLSRGWSLGDARRAAREWLEKLELWDKRNTVCARLSGGQKQRVAVAMVLASNADVLFLDEPTSGLDVEGKYRVWRALREMTSKGHVVLLTTHDMKETEILADKVVLISNGKTIAEGRVDELVSKIPYRHRVIVRNPLNKELIEKNFDGGKVLDLSDRMIVYAKTKKEAFTIASMIEAESVMVENIGLEDAYFYLTRNREVGEHV